MKIKLKTEELVSLIKYVTNYESTLNRFYADHVTSEIMKVWLRKMAVQLIKPHNGNHSFMLDQITLLALNRCLSWGQISDSFQYAVVANLQSKISPACRSI